MSENERERARTSENERETERIAKGGKARVRELDAGVKGRRESERAGAYARVLVCIRALSR